VDAFEHSGDPEHVSPYRLAAFDLVVLPRLQLAPTVLVVDAGVEVYHQLAEVRGGWSASSTLSNDRQVETSGAGEGAGGDGGRVVYKAESALPVGLQLNEDGVLAGKFESVGRTDPILITATDLGGSTVVYPPLILDVHAPLVSVWQVASSTAEDEANPDNQGRTHLPSAVQQRSYSHVPVELSVNSNLWYKLRSSNLPPGLKLNEGTGELYGTPKASGQFVFSVIAENAAGQTAVVNAGQLLVSVLDCDATSCQNGGRCIDAVKFDGEFACDCDGTGFVRNPGTGTCMMRASEGGGCGDDGGGNNGGGGGGGDDNDGDGGRPTAQTSLTAGSTVDSSGITLMSTLSPSSSAQTRDWTPVLTVAIILFIVLLVFGISVWLERKVQCGRGKDESPEKEDPYRRGGEGDTTDNLPKRNRLRVLKQPRVINIANLNILEQLGEGHYGVCHKAQLHNVGPAKQSSTGSNGRMTNSERTVAVKIAHDGMSEEDVATIDHESTVMSQFNQHPNVLELIGVVNADPERGTRLMLVMQCCDNGSLLGYLGKCNSDSLFLTTVTKFNLCVDVAKGMKYLGSISVVYGARFSTEIYTRGCHWIPRISLEANMRVTNAIPLGCPLFLPVHTVNRVQTLKASRPCSQKRADIFPTQMLGG
jgi:hypothetical protein